MEYDWCLQKIQIIKYQLNNVRICEINIYKNKIKYLKNHVYFYNL